MTHPPEPRRHPAPTTGFGEAAPRRVRETDEQPGHVVDPVASAGARPDEPNRHRPPLSASHIPTSPLSERFAVDREA